MPALPENCLSVEDTAKFLTVVPLTVRRLIAARKLRATRIGRRVVITPANLQKFLEANSD